MCGITGFIDFNNQSSEALLNAMTLSLQHRGPDSQGVIFKQQTAYQIGFGHRRLSIIDLSTDATQPMSYDGLDIVFNGEIYNYQEIREELIALGHKFKTHSDTEVILHSWKQWGERSIDRWTGMYAIVLYEEATNQIIAIRDRAGVKPLFYSFNNGLFVFGSELKSLVKHTAFKKEIDPSAAANFLQYGYVGSPHCIYKHTHKLAPGHLLRFDLNTRDLKTVQYWSVYDYYNKPKLSISFADALLETENVLQKAFEYRMVADVPVGVFLSGGYDSTCVAALLQKNSVQKLKTFTIGIEANKLDEAVFAKQIAAHLGADHTEYYCTASEALALIPQLPYYYDEPFADSSAIPTMLVSKMARKNVTVALSADAGDEIFAGYNRYDYVAKYKDKIAAMPRPLRKLLVGVMDAVPSEKIPVLKNKHNFHGRYDKLKNLLNDPSPSELMKNLTRVFSNTELDKLFSVPIKELITGHHSEKLISNSDSLDYMMAVDYETYLVDDILQKVDRATMSVGLEGREPFLDQNIIEWAAQLPSGYKYHNGNKKYILKQIVHKYVPLTMMDRPKMGFAIPLEKWLQNEMKEIVNSYLSEESLNAHGLFKTAAVTDLVTQFYKGHTERYLQIWHLLMFQMWYKAWC